MNTYMNQEKIQETTELSHMSLFTKIKLAIIGGLMLFIGLITSLFLLMISAIMLPFAAIKLWCLQKRFNEAVQSQTNSTDSDNASHDRVFEGEYTSE